MCLLIEVFLRAHAKDGKSLDDFKFGTVIGCFLGDGAAIIAIIAVKGLNSVKSHVPLCDNNRDQNHGRRDRQTNRQTDRQAGRQAGRQVGRQTETETERGTERQRQTEPDRQRDRQRIRE